MRVLDVDHIDPSRKLRPAHRQYSTPIRLSLWAKEMSNLQLLCANCHRIKTWEDRQPDMFVAPAPKAVQLALEAGGGAISTG